jgi:hypothetical protein
MVVMPYECLTATYPPTYNFQELKMILRLNSLGVKFVVLGTGGEELPYGLSDVVYTTSDTCLGPFAKSKTVAEIAAKHHLNLETEVAYYGGSYDDPLVLEMVAAVGICSSGTRRAAGHFSAVKGIKGQVKLSCPSLLWFLERIFN